MAFKVTKEILSISNPSFRNIPQTTIEDTARRRTRPTSIAQAQARKTASRTIIQVLFIFKKFVFLISLKFAKLNFHQL